MAVHTAPQGSEFGLGEPLRVAFCPPLVVVGPHTEIHKPATAFGNRDRSFSSANDGLGPEVLDPVVPGSTPATNNPLDSITITARRLGLH